MKPGVISVALRLSNKADSKVKAFADVSIGLDEDGTITLMGVSVLQSHGRPARVMAPARKGKQSWFDVVELRGRIQTMVESAVLAEYEKQTASK